MRLCQPELPESAYPIFGVLGSGSVCRAYVAWSEAELVTCPFHEYIRSKREPHFIYAADDSSFSASTSLAGVAWARFREIGFVTETIAVLLSGLNFPALISARLEKSTARPVEELKDVLRFAVRARPAAYTGAKSERAVMQALAKSRTYRELAISISNSRGSVGV